MAVRIGMIGTGNIAGAHLAAIKQVEQAKVVAVADIDRAKAEERAGMVGAKAFTDFREMVDKAELDAIWLCTPPAVRTEPIELAIEKKIPVFTEKPASESPKIARALAAKIEKAGLPVAVGYVLRHMKIVDRIRDYLSGDTISLVNSTYCCPMSLDYREGNPIAKWFFKKEISGGPIVEQGTHLFDLMRYLVGEAESLYAIGCNVTIPKDDDYTVEDAYAVAIKFASGMAGVHTHSWGHGRWRSGIIFYGEKGMYQLKCMANQLVVEKGSDETLVYTPQDDAMLTEDRAFVDMVASGDFSKIRSTYSDGVKTLELTSKCLEVLNLPLNRQ